jgi:NTP pyrophosphatase (non-canonical NTP hydrolase)
MKLDDLRKEVYALNVDKGWFDDSRSFGDDMALLHSEVSEMLEAYRVYGVNDATAVPHASNEYRPKPEGIGSEAADILIRLLDTCHRYNIDLESEFDRKMKFNWTRPTKHGGKIL